ncbi:uncharacterized protein LOC141876625 isoform X1 [Acropora palmata]|uniref:uncharacterized protein LOC141876625 isoform X1 n=1 Tax=Acropora palmata TaxID=6131 RepID=UPI003DA107DD
MELLRILLSMRWECFHQVIPKLVLSLQVNHFISQSTPDEIAYMAVDPPNTPSLSRYNYISYMSSSSINTSGRNSPPPGFHRDQIPSQPFHMVRGEGEFIPESQDHMILPRLHRTGNVWFDPLSHSQVRVFSSPSSEGSWRGSSFSFDRSTPKNELPRSTTPNWP